MLETVAVSIHRQLRMPIVGNLGHRLRIGVYWRTCLLVMWIILVIPCHRE